MLTADRWKPLSSLFGGMSVLALKSRQPQILSVGLDFMSV